MARTQPSKKPDKTTPRNPFFTRWKTPFGIAPFQKIEPRHFFPAFRKGMAEHRTEIAAIANSAARPTFKNTIVALEKSGRLLERVSDVFFNLASADTNEDLQNIERDVAPLLSKHNSSMFLNARLFKRVDQLFDEREKLGLNSEDMRVLERMHLAFVRAGARLRPREKKRVAEINARLAELTTAFHQNVLADEQTWRLALREDSDFAGLPAGFRSSAEQVASDLGVAAKGVITLSRSSIEPFLQYSARRDLREVAFKAWIKRGENAGSTDNRKLAADIIALRVELAKLMGYRTYADYSLKDTMAKTPSAVRDLLTAVWTPALARAAEERLALSRLAQAAGENAAIAGWDWRFYAEKERHARFDIGDAELRPYFQLDRMIEAAFDTASRLFGLRFKVRDDVPVYHRDVRAWEVLSRDGTHIGLFLGDYFARSSKRSGAWMSSYRGQHKLDGVVRPIIVNVMSFARGASDEPSLLSYDEANTLFHEFGHALHGLLSDVIYPSISGTAVSRDFVELPSQLFEHWLGQPEVLKRFALHYKTGKPMPDSLLRRLEASRKFNQGFQTVEYTASALVDMELHALEEASELDVSDFETRILAELGMPEEIVMRHRIPHFMHIMGGYQAGYYSYLWSEVMDADAFAAFQEAGNIFDPATAKRLKSFIYGAGNSRDPLEAYVAFRGRAPDIKGLLRKRGLST